MAKKKPIPKKIAKKSPDKSTKKAKGQAGFRPLGDRVLIRETMKDSHEKSPSGIIIPVSSEKDSGAKHGVVVAMGLGRFEDGKRVPMTLTLGDEVLFQWGEKVTISGEEYYLVREGEILGILK